MDGLLDRAADVEFLAVLSRFRLDFHACLTARGDELSELAGLPLPRAADGRLVLAVDVSSWRRPARGGCSAMFMGGGRAARR